MRTLLILSAALFLAVSAGAREDGSGYRDRSGGTSGAGFDFCSQGKFLLFTGNCKAPEGSPYKDSISLKACEDVNSVLTSGLYGLYPYSRVYRYNSLPSGELHERLVQSSVLGFFLIGEGDVNGGLVTDAGRSDAAYPDAASCVALYDVFGGFMSHSKYSPDVAAPKKLRGRVLAKAQFVYKGEGAADGSWPKLCHPKLGVVYPTRTFAGRMKNDALKLINDLQEEKKKQVLTVLKDICGSCDIYSGSGSPVAALCPPQSDLCSGKPLSPEDAKLLLKNYCYAIHPELIPAEPE